VAVGIFYHLETNNVADVSVFMVKHSTNNLLFSLKRILPLLAICLLSSLAMATSSSNLSLLQFRLVVDIRTDDSEPMTLGVLDYSQHPPRPEVLNVQRTVLLDQTAVKSAVAAWPSMGQPQIFIRLTDDGAKQLAEATRANIGKGLAIFIDGKLHSAPRITSEINGGEVVITGFSKQGAQDFAARLNGSPAGAARPGDNMVFFAIAVLVVIALAVATWFGIRRRGASNTA
jgi:hypothetical protein